MSVVIKPPSDIYENVPLNTKKVFLAGSIEMGKAIDWQKKVENSLKDLSVVIYNPRRDDWDSSWIQKIENPKFNEQVTWELSALEQSDVIAMYFAPKTASPISLLELGLHIGKNPEKLTVFCPDGYEKKGNVDITCQRYGVTVFTDYNAWITSVLTKLKVLTKIK